MLRIENLIPIGADRAISRRVLANKLRVSDRTARREVELARKRGVLILHSKTGGYYRPTRNDVDNVLRFVRVEEKRARSIFANLRAARRFLRDECGLKQILLSEAERRNG